MKTISIKDEIYEELVKLKGENESFSDVIKRLIKGKDFNMDRYFGCLKDSDVLDEIEEYSRKFRASARFRV